jgi:hypothetical protein
MRWIVLALACSAAVSCAVSEEPEFFEVDPNIGFAGCGTGMMEFVQVGTVTEPLQEEDLVVFRIAEGARGDAHPGRIVGVMGSRNAQIMWIDQGLAWCRFQGPDRDASLPVVGSVVWCYRYPKSPPPLPRLRIPKLNGSIVEVRENGKLFLSDISSRPYGVPWQRGWTFAIFWESTYLGDAVTCGEEGSKLLLRLILPNRDQRPPRPGDLLANCLEAR